MRLNRGRAARWTVEHKVLATAPGGANRFTESIQKTEGALAEAEETASEGLEEVVKARQAVIEELGKKKLDRAKLQAAEIEETQASERYKDLDRAAVHARAELNDLRRARDRWLALREYEESQKK